MSVSVSFSNNSPSYPLVTETNHGLDCIETWAFKQQKQQHFYVSPEECLQVNYLLSVFLEELKQSIDFSLNDCESNQLRKISELLSPLVDNDDVWLNLNDLEELIVAFRNNLYFDSKNEQNPILDQAIEQLDSNMQFYKPYFQTNKKELISRTFSSSLLKNWFKSIIQKQDLLTPNLSENEQNKARTLHLFLLCALEDFQEEISNNPHLDTSDIEFDQLVVGDLKKPLFVLFQDPRQYVILNRKFSFSSLLEYISIIRTHAYIELSPCNYEKLERILKNVEAIVNLQAFLPKKWQKLRLFLKLGILKQKQLSVRPDAASKGFNPVVQTPSPITLINRCARADAENLLSTKYRKLGKWLFEQLQFISFDQLCKSIETSCKQLEGEIKTTGPYVMMGVKEKSQSWLADIAYRFLPKDNLPTHLAIAETEDDIYDVMDKNILDHNIMFIDDGIYSGEQLERTLNKLKKVLINLDTSLQKTTGHALFFQQQRLVTNIVGYASPQKIQTILQKYSFDHYNVKLQIVCNHHIPTLGDLVQKSSLDDREKKLLFDVAIGYGDETYEPISSSYLTIPLVSTEWKTPDNLSLISYCSEGSLLTKTVRKQDKNPFVLPAFFNHPSINSFFETTPIVHVRPPYKTMPKLLKTGV